MCLPQNVGDAHILLKITPKSLKGRDLKQATFPDGVRQPHRQLKGRYKTKRNRAYARLLEQNNSKKVNDDGEIRTDAVSAQFC
jgi:hypothetical protein